jgi:hypothetical protein
LDADFELSPTPTPGNIIEIRGSYGNATGAGRGNTTGSDGAYTGYANNIENSLRHLETLGIFAVTVNATTTVQKANLGIIFPKGRFLNVVVNNRSGAAFHSSDAFCVITLTPLENFLQDGA